jgi:hypothetical protein
MDKSSICTSARTITSQWLTSSPIKAQVAHRFFVARLFVHYYSGEEWKTLLTEDTDLAG